MGESEICSFVFLVTDYEGNGGELAVGSEDFGGGGENAVFVVWTWEVGECEGCVGCVGGGREGCGEKRFIRKGSETFECVGGILTTAGEYDLVVYCLCARTVNCFGGSDGSGIHDCAAE